MSTETKANVEAAAARVAAAQDELKAAHKAYVAAFRTSLVALCNEYGLTIEAGEYGGVFIVGTGALVTEDDFSFSC